MSTSFQSFSSIVHEHSHRAALTSLFFPAKPAEPTNPTPPKITAITAQRDLGDGQICLLAHFEPDPVTKQAPPALWISEDELDQRARDVLLRYYHNFGGRDAAVGPQTRFIPRAIIDERWGPVVKDKRGRAVECYMEYKIVWVGYPDSVAEWRDEREVPDVIKEEWVFVKRQRARRELRGVLRDGEEWARGSGDELELERRAGAGRLPPLRSQEAKKRK